MEEIEIGQIWKQKNGHEKIRITQVGETCIDFYWETYPRYNSNIRRDSLLLLYELDDEFKNRKKLKERYGL